MDTARCSPVCLDLMVGLPMDRDPSPARGMGTGTRPEVAGGAASMTNEEAKILEANRRLTQVSEENRRMAEMIAYLYGSQIARRSLECEGEGEGEPRHCTAASPTSPVGKKRGRESMDTSCDTNCNKKSSAVDADHVESPISDGSCRRIKVKRVSTRIDPSDTNLVVKDGYHWRKYGQKVTRDNPSPRAYFRCAFAPSCPVKKKVQRSAEDSSVLEATYEGEHNHPHPARSGSVPSCSTRSGSVPCSISINSSGPTITLDLTKNGGGVQVVEAGEAAPDLKKVSREAASPEFRRALVEQMASELTSDPKFTDALTAAILQRLPDY